MNKENILRVADAIEKGELVKRGIGFNMTPWSGSTSVEWPDMTGRGCGTVACIGGHAEILSGEDFDDFSLLDYFDLPDETIDNLIFTDDPNAVTPTHAVAVLRHLAETGEVDWSIPDPGAAK